MGNSAGVQSKPSACPLMPSEIAMMNDLQTVTAVKNIRSLISTEEVVASMFEIIRPPFVINVASSLQVQLVKDSWNCILNGNIAKYSRRTDSAVTCLGWFVKWFVITLV
jgi:hypothetical protein